MGLCLSKQREKHNVFRCGGQSMSKASNKVSSSIEDSAFRTCGEILRSPNLVDFSFNELKEATSSFTRQAILGSGNSGTVFKGWIDEHSLKASAPKNGIPVAVKLLSRDGCQGQEEWLAEIKNLGLLRHANLVKLIGYCSEEDYRLLVYEFVPNGSLENYIFNKGGDSKIQALSWNVLVKVALGVAKGLAFLHDEVDVIYRGFKSSNILLDSNYNAKLSDFRLARDGPTGSNTHISTRVLGMEEYAAPEYIRTGHLSRKSDVYGFGIVLLEMTSSKRAKELKKLIKEQNVGNWTRNLRGRQVSQVFNPAISGIYAACCMLKVVQLAIQCVSVDAKARPNMKDVVEVLEQVQNCGRSFVTMEQKFR